MIVSDTLFPPLQQVFHDRLVELFAWEPDIKTCTDREWRLWAYLCRRAWRPLYQALKAEYVRLWGKNCSFGYFFPEHMHNSVWRRARATYKEMMP